MSTILPADPGSRISLCARGFGEWQFLANNNPIQTEAPKLVSSGNYVVDYQGY